MSRRLFLSLGLLFASVFALPISASARGDSSSDLPSGKMPSFITVEDLVREYFSSKKIHSDDLISQGDVKPIFAILAKHGWPVADQDAILKQLLADKSFLVKTLRTERGKVLARDTARFPGGLDRLDRLSRLPHGHTFVEGLISGPDGYKLFEYMTQTPGGRVLGQQVEHTPKGRKFNQSTGRIYTSDDLLMRLRQSYDAATAQAARES